MLSGEWFLSLISINTPLLFSIARARVRVLLHFRGSSLYPASLFPFVLLLFSIILEAPVIRRKHLFEISRHLCLKRTRGRQKLDEERQKHKVETHTRTP